MPQSEEMKTPDILLGALRQYQHNDCSGLIAGFDYKETIKVVRKLEFELGELLAILHRDGGHYVQEHGWEKAVEDAKKLAAQNATL